MRGRLLWTGEYRPVRQPEKVGDNTVVLADVCYLGEVKEPERLAELEAEKKRLADLLRVWRRNGAIPDVVSATSRRKKRIEEEIRNLPRVEIWMREYVTLSR